MGEALCTHIRCANATIQRLNSWDLGMVKVSCLIAGLVLAKIFPAVLTAPAWVYVAALLAATVPITWRVLPLYAAARIRERRSQIVLPSDSQNSSSGRG